MILAQQQTENPFRMIKAASNPSKKTNPHNENILPVFKINYEGDILYGNYASLNLLHDLGVSVHRRLSQKFLSQYFSLTEKNINTDIIISTHDSDIYFSVVSYHETGYIGFYAYEIKSKI